MGGWFRERKEAEEERVIQERERRSESGVPGGNGSSERLESCGRGRLSKGRGCEEEEGCSGNGKSGSEKGLRGRRWLRRGHRMEVVRREWMGFSEPSGGGEDERERI